MLLATCVCAASGAPAALLVVLPAVPTAPPVAWWRGGVVTASVLLLLVVQQGRQQHLLLHAPRPHERTWWAAWVTARATATAGRPACRTTHARRRSEGGLKAMETPGSSFLRSAPRQPTFCYRRRHQLAYGRRQSESGSRRDCRTRMVLLSSLTARLPSGHTLRMKTCHLHSFASTGNRRWPPGRAWLKLEPWQQKRHKRHCKNCR